MPAPAVTLLAVETVGAKPVTVTAPHIGVTDTPTLVDSNSTHATDPRIVQKSLPSTAAAPPTSCALGLRSSDKRKPRTLIRGCQIRSTRGSRRC